MTSTSIAPCNPEAITDCWAFVKARHAMFPRRFLDKAPPPWTDDPILAEWKFTNCFRELDRLTRYAIVHILGRDIEPMAKLWALLLFRWFVVVDTYEDLAKAGQVDPATFDPSCAREVLLARARADQKVYTSAFIVNFTSAHYQGPRVKGETKIYQSIERLTEAHRRLPEIYGRVGAAGSMERATQILTELPGVGLFNAYQMLVDATYLEGFLSFRDQNDWAAIAGPTSGTWKGLQMLGIANPKRDGVPAMCWLRDNQPALRGPRLTLANVANCLCEWSKYVRARDGGQKPREKYDPATAAPIDPTLWSMELIVHYSYHPRRPSRPSMAA